MSEKPELTLTRLSHGEPLAYRCALCGQSFLFPEDRTPKEGAAELWAAFHEHVREIHAAVKISGVESEMEENTISEGLQHRLAMTPAMMRIFAASPVVRGGYLSFSMALASGGLDAKFREQIALAVARANHSEVSVALHSDIAKGIGMSEDEIRASQRCHSDDAKRTAAMKFVSELVAWRGQVSPEAVLRIRDAGYGDAEIAEIAANAWVVTLANCLECIAASQAEPDGAPGPGLFPA